MTTYCIYVEHICVPPDPSLNWVQYFAVTFTSIEISSSPYAMYILRQWLPVLFLTWAISVLSSPLAVSNPPSLSSANVKLAEFTRTFANLSAIDIPQDLKLYLQFQAPSPQPQTAYYYNTIAALRQLALGDFDGLMFGQRFVTSKFPNTPITLVTRSGQIQRRYVVWGLLLALAFMTEETGLCVTTFALLWQGMSVGRLTFGIPGMLSQAPESHTNGTESTTPGSVSSIDGFNVTNRPASSGGSANDADLSSYATRVTVAITRSGDNLNPHDVFMGIAGALAEAAERNPEQRIDEWSSQLWNFDSRFDTRQVRLFRAEQPLYTFRVLIESLAEVTDYFVNYQAFYEISAIIKVNQVMVGISRLGHRMAGRLLGSGNQSTSAGSTA